ncbi:hypothetical protein GCM10022222_51530 [Amycolatopsis ultiminotia]|uniref:Transposase n=1 Tax=Amycolatopsis ultiminotia TaxID=543629 RepID=A0ABP6X569_9PSEU
MSSRSISRTRPTAGAGARPDTIDAEAAARAVLSGRAAAHAKVGDGHVEWIRLFKLAKASATKSRTQAINQLKAIHPRRRRTRSA